MQMVRSTITELSADLLVQASALVCEAFSDPIDAYGCLEPTVVLLSVDENKVVGHSFLYA